MKAVLLAGGLGTRLSEETHLKPKPMVEIGGKPILWHIMKIYFANGIRDFVICGGYKCEVIKQYFANYALNMSDIVVDLEAGSVSTIRSNSEPWTVTIVDTGAETMTGGRLKRVRHLLGEQTFCMTYGDGVGNVNIRALIDFHKSHGKLATLTAAAPPGRFGALDISAGAQVASFVEKPSGDGSYINAGFFVLEPGVIDYIDGDDASWEREPLERLASAGELYAYKHDGFWQPMDTLRDKRNLERIWQEGNAEWKVWT